MAEGPVELKRWLSALPAGERKRIDVRCYLVVGVRQDGTACRRKQMSRMLKAQLQR